MERVRVIYHHEDDAWWAESPDVPGFTAAGSTLGEVRSLVREGVPFHLEMSAGDVELVESTDTDGLVVDVHFTSKLGVGVTSGACLGTVRVSPAARTPVWA